MTGFYLNGNMIIHTDPSTDRQPAIRRAYAVATSPERAAEMVELLNLGMQAREAKPREFVLHPGLDVPDMLSDSEPHHPFKVADARLQEQIDQLTAVVGQVQEYLSEYNAWNQGAMGKRRPTPPWDRAEPDATVRPRESGSTWGNQ